MITEQETIVSQEKFDEMVHELDNLKTVRRTEIAKNLEYARSLGDLSENAEYQEGARPAGRDGRAHPPARGPREARAHTERRQEEGHCRFGSVVAIKKEGGSDMHEYTIVGSEEADMRSHKLSHVSPLGAALMGKKKGDVFTFETPNGKQTYTIDKVA